jgi:hypothetical protein
MVDSKAKYGILQDKLLAKGFMPTSKGGHCLRLVQIKLLQNSIHFSKNIPSNIFQSIYLGIPVPLVLVYQIKS